MKNKTNRTKDKGSVRKPVFITGTYESCMDYVSKLKGDGFFVFNLAYVSENENFREIDRFLWESRHKDDGIGRKYSNRYSGVAVIDVTAWYKRYPNEYFKAFFYFLKDQYFILEDIVFIAEKCDDALLEHLSGFFETERVSLDKEERGGVTAERGPGRGRIGFEI